MRGQGQAKQNELGVIDQVSLIILDITRQDLMEKALIEAYKEKEILTSGRFIIGSRSNMQVIVVTHLNAITNNYRSNRPNPV